MIRTKFLARPALGLALAIGTVGAAALVSTPAVAAKKKEEAPAAPKLKLSKEYMAASNAVIIDWNNVKGRADVAAAAAELKAASAAFEGATTAAAQKEAEANFEAKQKAVVALIQPQIDKLQAAMPAAKTADERFHAGQIMIDMGLFAMSQPLQRQALQLQLDSGLVAPDKVALYNFYVGKFAYTAKDWRAARTALDAATKGGYHEAEADRLLAETYFAENDARGGLASMRTSIDAIRAAGKPVSTSMLQRGLNVAIDAIVPEQFSFFATELLATKPDKNSWSRAVYGLRRMNKYADEESLDVVRLMDRTNSYANASDYNEYMELGIRMGLPKEVLAAADKAVAAGKMSASDATLAENRRMAQSRMKDDTAQGLVRGYERDAVAPNASLKTLIGAGDTFLTYGELAKAEAAFTRALTMPGVDTARVLTRIGIIQFDLGRYADAQATFAKVTGPREPLAKLWAIAAKLKAGTTVP